MKAPKITMAAARVNADLKQREVADALHIRRETYMRYETGKSAISMELAVKFAKVVNFPFSYIRFFVPKNIA